MCQQGNLDRLSRKILSLNTLAVGILDRQWRGRHPHSALCWSPTCISPRRTTTPENEEDILNALLYTKHAVRQSFSIHSLDLSLTFSGRTLPLVILRLIYLYNLSHTATDTTWRSFSLALVTVLHADISIVAACIPFFKPIVDSLSVGMIANDLHFSLESNESLSPTPNHPHSGGGILSRGTIFSSLSKGPEKGSKGSGSGKSSMPSGGSKSQVSYPTVREGWELREGLKKSSNSRS